MNVLILTPDAVGSTLLQRLLTIYMQFHVFDRPVINLHELTNGLEKYYSPEFNREIVSKKRVQNWGYYQTLEQVVNLLSSVDHYKTSRLAQYHIKKRQDPLEKQIPFYQYLDDNFFVIACRRHNVFEHALSMCLNKITKKLNVYSHKEKIDTFIDFYAAGTQIDERVFVTQLESYREYLNWSELHFNVGSYFYYDQHVIEIENYILNLPIFDSQPQKIGWQEKFDIGFNDWNRYHHALSDLGSLDLTELKAIRSNVSEQLIAIKQNALEKYQQLALPWWPNINYQYELDNLPQDIKAQFTSMICYEKSRQLLISSTSVSKAFLEKNDMAYNSANGAIQRMQELDIIPGPPPIKKQTLREKIKIIKNFDQCLEIYNDWIENHRDIGRPLNHNDFTDQHNQENNFWKSSMLLDHKS